MVGFVERIIVGMGYPGLLLLMVVENLFPPLPSELILPLAGFFVSQGELGLITTIAFSTLGSVSGALVLYALGRFLGEKRVRRLLRRYGTPIGISVAGFDRSAAILRQRAPAILFWSRFVPGLRSVISIPAGVTAIPVNSFVLWTSLSALCWNSVLIGAGLLLGQNWTVVVRVVDRYQTVLLWLGGAVLLAVILKRVVSKVRKRRAREGQEDLD